MMRQNTSAPTDRLLRLTLLLVGVLTALALAGGRFANATAPPPLEEFEHACGSANPYFATSCYIRGNQLADPAVVAFHDSLNNRDHYVLATGRQVGATYGQAYSDIEKAYYVSAYHKRGTLFGPGGSGMIYRIDLTTGRVTEWADVPNAGPNRHEASGATGPDTKARDYVGKTSLGDLDITEDQTQLYVVNLFDRKIYRFNIADKSLVGTIDHGAQGEPWAEDARPFGLALRFGKLFHAVVNTAFSTQGEKDIEALVYESDLDGSNMRVVNRFKLAYNRGLAFYLQIGGNEIEIPAKWHPWKDGYNTTGPDRDGLRLLDNAYPQPMLTDIEFTDNQDMILGFRDRFGDMGYNGPNDLGAPAERPAVGVGDIVLGRYDAATGTWSTVPAPEFYFQDSGPGLHETNSTHFETSYGGLGRVKAVDVVVNTALDPESDYSGGAIWFNNATGGDLAREDIYKAENVRTFGKANGLGDLELLCGPEEVPTLTPTATPIPTATDTPTLPPTITETPESTPTRRPTPTVTETPTPSVYRIYLPFVQKAEVCIPDAYHTDVVLVLDRSTSMLRPVEEGGLAKNEAAIEAAKAFVRQLDFSPDMLGRHDQVAIVGFNDSAWTETDLTNDLGTALDSLERIRTKTIEGTRLDLALVEGQKPLDGPRHKPENRPVLVLLTDGIPNRVPTPTGGGVQEDTVLVAARAAKARGTRLYSIGLGKPTDILPRLLIDAASERWMYYYAPKPEDLAGIYTQIAHTFDECGPQRFPVPTPCVAEEVHTDVVLVLDMSTSMYRETRAGRTKQAAALEAAKAFVSDLDLERDGWGRQDQVAIVGFNESAWTAIGLSENRVLVNGALDGLAARAHEGTRLDLAFKEGQAALERGPRLAENRGVLILLTDGLPNQVPTPMAGGTQEDTVLQQAARAKEKGTRVYTIGLGKPEDILSWMLEAAASEPSMYYYAPDGEDLADIYRQIAGRITECAPVP